MKHNCNSLFCGCFTSLGYFLFRQGRVRGSRLRLLVRAKLQAVLFKLGCLTHRNCGKVILFGVLLMIVCSIGLTRAKVETDAEKLWVEGTFIADVLPCQVNKRRCRPFV